MLPPIMPYPGSPAQTRLEGPWEDHGSLCSTAPKGDEQGFRYCINAHPEYDASGKTVYVTWTRENEIYGVDLEWE